MMLRITEAIRTALSFSRKLEHHFGAIPCFVAPYHLDPATS